ncbi:MAG: stage II sporulation protein M [Egibacteraceae bacterium]
MDLDRFIAAHQESWRRLDDLATRAGRRRSALSAEEASDLLEGYQRASTHLSLARTRYTEPALTAQLTRLVARTGSVVYGTRAPTWRAAVGFVTDTFPAALWRIRAFVGVATVLFCLPALAVAVWLSGSPRALDVAAPPALRESYVERDFAEYYTADPSAQFATEVSTNNIQVGILAFAGGVLLCVPTAFVLATNGANLGSAAALFATAGQLDRFFGLILPHGLLELTAIFVAGGTGLRLGWTLVDPGDRRRSDALVEEGRRAIVVVIGLVGVFLVAGLIEGFVTGSALPTWARVGIGVLAQLGFLAYVAARGRSATARGLTGALGEDELSQSRPPAFTRR